MAGGDIAPQSDSGDEPVGLVGGEESDTLGGALRRARRERGLTVQQIAATTRIPARHLEALERDDIGAVPGGMYLRAEVRAYADAVGLNRSVALDYLNAALNPPIVADVAAPVPATRGLRAAGWGAAAIAGVSLVIAAVVLWPARDTRETSSDAPVSSDSRATSDQAVTASASENGAARTSDAAPAVTFDTAASAPTSGAKESSPLVASGEAITTEEHPPAADPVLEIVTQPAGARVTIDGIGWGITPVTIRYLSPGNKQLRITRDGFASEERMIRFSAGQPRTTVRINLQQAQ